MGNQQNKSNALHCDSSAMSVPVDNEAHLDPLRTFIRNSPSFSVKTFTDVERLSEQQTTKSPLTIINNLSNITPSPQKTGKHEQARCEMLGQRDVNISARTSLKQSIRRSTNAEIQFKTIAISQQTFIKLKEQDPLQHYEMKEKIGQGNFGEVFRAVLKQSGQQRAIKILKVKLMREENKKQFFAEMSLLSKLNHPSIITLYQLFHYNQKYYVVMEYCRGGTIIKALKRLKNKSEDVIAKIMRQLLSALSYMHSLHIIHRDIKLENIVLLSKAEDCITIKIIDFGTAVQNKHKMVQNYPIAGTLSYLAPEVLGGTLTEKSDIWSSGVLMYIMLTGSTPFRGKNESETRLNILKKYIDYDGPQLSEVSQQAKDLLKSMLTRSIADRILAFDALHHSWLDLSVRPKTASLNNLDLLASYCRNNNFIAMIESYLSLKKITQQERQKLAQIFTTIDSDGNGQIERDQLLQVFKRKKLWKASEYTQQQLLLIVSSIDINNSGKIDFNEFIIAMYDKRKVYMRDSLSEAFEYFDMDHTGYIQIDELREMLKGGDNAEIDYFLHQLDTDSDNKISKDEFIDYLLNY